MEIILVLLLFFFVLRPAAGWLIRGLLRRQARRYQAKTGENAASPEKKREKVFGRDDGEYVDYEELPPSNNKKK